MAVDVLVLNTAVTDFRRADFEFADELVGKGGLAKCETKDMPDYSQQHYKDWIDEGSATAGGPGNSAPLIARAGLNIAVGVNLGRGDFNGLDAQGRFFHDLMTENNVDMSQTFIHPSLPSGTTFIHDKGSEERGGIAYFPNANNDFNFEYFKCSVERLNPKAVYYMYSGLSDRGDANDGKDLADFIKWCRGKGTVTIADSHTLTGNPQELIDSAAVVAEYKLLEPLLPELDLFFTSYDEARMIENTIGGKNRPENLSEDEYIPGFLDFLADKFWKDNDRTRMFGVTVSNGAYEKHIRPNNNPSTPAKVESDFMAGEVIDLVGAGDSFRAGVISYIAKNIEEFKTGNIDFTRAIQMGNLFASLYIKAPLNDRYGNIGSYDKMLEVVKSRTVYDNFADLLADLI
jgi:sugar/nucleoside kinase (ribokinase family)